MSCFYKRHQEDLERLLEPIRSGGEGVRSYAESILYFFCVGFLGSLVH